MRFIDKIKILERVDALIKRGATGNPKELAFRLNISERAVYDLINIMKNMDAPIYYCSSKNSYLYEYEVELSMGFIKKTKNILKVQGGANKNCQYKFLTAEILQ